jgi:sugar lactone lactonase YvrE
MPIRLDYDYQKTYTTTIIRAVGITTLTGKRGTLPQPSPSDANSIWMATNGTGGGTGTQADPVNDLSVANGLLGGAKTTIHIFRNGAIGDLSFTETNSVVLLSTHNIQVEEGEKADIDLTTFGAGLSLSGSNTINGIKFQTTDTGAAGIAIAGNTITLDNCEVEYLGEIVSGKYAYGAPALAMSGSLTNININYCVLRGQSGIGSFDSVNLSVNNCILFYQIQKPITDNAISGGIIIVSGGAVTLRNTSINRCLFVNYSTITTTTFKNVSTPAILVWTSGTPQNPGPNITTSDCHFFNTTTPLAAHKNFIGTFTYTNCLLGTDLAVVSTDLNNIFNANFTVTNTNPLDIDTAPMFESDTEVNNFNADRSKLQFEGKATPDGSSRYFLTSTLVGAGTGISGQFISSFPTSIFDVSATNPNGITYARDNTLWIVDIATDKVYNVSLTGNLIFSFPVTTFDVSAANPIAICEDNDGIHLWVSVLAATSKIYKITKLGSLVSSFTYGTYGGNFAQGIDMDSNGTLWVSDIVSSTVFNITTAGAVISSFSFTCDPIAVDNGNLWVNNTTTDITSKLDKLGNLLGTFPNSNYDPLAIGMGDCTIALDGNMWLCDGVTDKIYRISIINYDVNPWDETTVLNTQAFIGNSLELKWPPDALELNFSAVEPINLTDINANLHIDYDGRKRRFVLTFNENTHVSNLEWKRLVDILFNKSVKALVLKSNSGVNSNLFEQNPSTGTFSSADNSVDPQRATPMVPNHWQGFWITIATKDYYIESNDTTKLYLIDKTGAGLPSDGVITFIISYILVQNNAADFIVKQNNFTQFQKGGDYTEDQTEVRPYDYGISSITFNEVEDLEEALV